LTPRILIAGDDGQQRQWLRHHLQSLWPEADPPCLDLQQFVQHLDTITPRNYDAALLCAWFGHSRQEHSQGAEWLRELRRERSLPPLIVVAAHGNELSAVRAIRLGAAEYLPRDLLDAQQLGRTLRKVIHASRRRARRRAIAGALQHQRPAPDLEVPNYTLLRELGRSARARVWLAESATLRRPVALKIGQPQPHDPGGQPQFAHEYKAIAALRDPGIVDIYDYGVHDGREYLAMEYFPCGDLKQRLLQPMDCGAAVTYVRRIAHALRVVHGAGLLHRDLKPPNIMLRPDGTTVLIDFGLAKHVDSSTSNTALGVLRGSPYYMSPEQVQGSVLDARSDLYALGVVFFEMLTGRKPYTALTAIDLMHQHVKGKRPALPAELAAFEPLIARLMARERDERYAHVDALLAALDELPAAPPRAAAASCA
jgi:eukaryotic-like serine/threonine-protein kinase